jgi:hypothetical protein
MSSIETAILTAGLVVLSLWLGNSYSEKQQELVASYPFFQGQ